MSFRTLLPIVQSLVFLVKISFFLLGLVGYFFRHERNYCEMTYMFEYPIYHPISMPTEIEKQYPRYALYSYCEGVGCEAHRQNHFSGSPVLFIVGNADSYRQVRSLGSVAYRMGNNQLDFFSIDFNEELSALFGGVLEPQTEFVARAIQTILKLYKSKQTIILVGNSIGGLLARAVFLQPSKQFDPESVRVIITQATPHQAPVIHADSDVENFYERMNEYWRTEWNNSLKHIVLLSLAGGDRDHLVRSDLCSLHGLVDESRSIDTLTTAVPHVWTSTDHRCIVWCRQLVLATTRALLEIVRDKNQNPQATMQILKRHFSPSLDLAQRPTTTLTQKTPPIVITQSSMSIVRNKRKDANEQSDYSIPVKQSQYDTIFIHSTNARVYLINENTTTDMTDALLSIPPSYGHRKMIRFDIAQLHDTDSILVRLANDKSEVDIYQTMTIHEEKVELSTFGSKIFHFNQTGYVKLSFPTLIHLWQVYTVRLASDNNQKVPLLRFHVPWSNEDLYNLISLRDPSSESSSPLLSKSLHRQMRLKLHRPPRYTEQQEHASLELFLDSKSSYTLHIDYSFLDILAQMIRYYIFLLPSFLFTVLCISFSLQINNVALRTYQTMLAWQVHLPVALAMTLLYKIIVIVFPSSNLVVNVHSNGYYFFWLPFLVYFLALSLWAIVSFLLDCAFFDLVRPWFFPLFNQILDELRRQPKIARYIQWSILMIPFFCAFILSGSSSHIGLFFLAFLHTFWRGTINRSLREILTILLLFHGLLVVLHLPGFVVHLRSVFVQGPFPLYTLMHDPSLLSAIICLLAFDLRFVFNRSLPRFLIPFKMLLHTYARLILTLLAVASQIFCSYTMYRLWMLIFFVFIHAAILFFVPIHRE